MYTVQQGKPPVVPSDLSFAAKDHHCTQGPGDKGGSQEIGAYTPKQQVIFDLFNKIRSMSNNSDSDE